MILRNSNLLTVISFYFALISIFIFGSFNFCVKFANSSFFIKCSYFTTVVLSVTNKTCCVSIKLSIISRQYLRILVEVVSTFGIVVGK